MEGITVYFCYIVIIGNEIADKLARETLKKNMVEVEVPLGRSEIKFEINRKLIQEWQQRRENSRTGRWFYSIEKSVGKKSTVLEDIEKK